MKKQEKILLVLLATAGGFSLILVQYLSQVITAQELVSVEAHLVFLAVISMFMGDSYTGW